MMLHYVFKIDDLDTYTYSIEPKYLLIDQNKNDPKYHIIPVGQLRYDKKGTVKHESHCSFCGKREGLLLLCG